MIIAVCTAAPPLRNSPSDAIYKSDLILVGDLVSGNKTPSSDVSDRQAKVRVLEVLKGDGRIAGQEIDVQWRYAEQPQEAAGPGTAIEPVHALWFLNRGRRSGDYEAMWAGTFADAIGGYFVSLPEGQPQAPLIAASNMDYQRKVAGELAWAMQKTAIAGGDRLDAEAPLSGGVKRERQGAFVSRPNAVHTTASKWFTPGGPNPLRVDEVRLHFDSLANLFEDLDAEGIRDVSQYLMKQPNIRLQAVGLLSELRARNVDTLVQMETVYSRLAMTWNAYNLAVAASLISVRGNEAAIHAVGRMCVSETRIFPFCEGAVVQLSAAKSRIALPYLETMLDHPEPRVRTQAAEGICSTVTSDLDLRVLADRPLVTACGFGTLVANRIGNHGPNIAAANGPNVSDLREWFGTHSQQIRSVTGTESPRAPSWFTSTQ